MEATTKKVEELRTIIIKEIKQDITMKQAQQIAQNLIGYFSLLADIHQRIKSHEQKTRKLE